MMNEDQSMFAEMLGIKKQAPAKKVQVVRPVSRPCMDTVDMVDELDVQREVVEVMALEKAELEEERAALEREKENLERDKRNLEMAMTTLEMEKAALESSKMSLELEKSALERERSALMERVSVLETDFAELKNELDSARAGNAELEEKLARMGRSLAAARRSAAESGAIAKTRGGV
jgi:predicted  nucleic acid-binding Zn-ribbon protein